MNILNSADTAATINLITRNARGTTTTSDGATAAGKIIKENLPDIISAGFDMPHPTSIFEGVPPFSFISNGEPLVNWLIYGNTVEGVSVGEKTDNLFDSSTETKNTYITSVNIISTSSVTNISDYIAINDTTLTLSGRRTTALQSQNERAYCFYTEDKTFIEGSTYNADIMTPVEITVPDNAVYIRFAYDKSFEGAVMLNIGDTAKSYEPYGYKIPVVCGGVTTNIYIDEPLTAGETITYNETGVIIPTTMFLNTLSVGTTVQPEKVFIEYVK